MTICMLIWDYWPGREGGAQRQCRKLSHALSRQGTSILVITQRNSWRGRRTIVDQDIPVVRLGMLAPLAAVAISIHKWKTRWTRANYEYGPGAAGPGRQWGISTPFWWLARLSFMFAVKKYLGRNHRDVNLIHVHESNWIAGFAAWLGAEVGLPVLCKAATWPCMTPMGADVPFRSSFRDWRLRIHFIALNSAMAAELRAANIHASRVHVIPNGVEIPSEYASVQTNREVLFIANFTQGNHLKAYDILLNAWSRVHKRDRAARLVMVGSGDNRPWRKRALDLDCGSSVFFSGFAERPDDFYRCAAVFVLPSRREGMSNALLEAQSWGIPAVVSAIPSNLAVVDDEINGLVVPVEDAGMLAEAIMRLTADPALRARLGNQARKRMTRDFSIAAVSARIAGLYLEIISAAEKNI